MGEKIQFSVGDVVQLKSGGPKMTINIIDKDFADCRWFGNDGISIYQKAVPLAILQKAETDQKKKSSRSSYAG